MRPPTKRIPYSRLLRWRERCSCVDPHSVQCAARIVLLTPVSARTFLAHYRAEGADQNVKVEPERPVADVIAVERRLHFEIAMAARRDLPETGQPGRNLRADAPKLRIEAGIIIDRERTRPDQAHI